MPEYGPVVTPDGFACRTDECPSRGGEGGGPDVVSAPDLLKSDDIGFSDYPLRNLLDGRGEPEKTIDII